MNAYSHPLRTAAAWLVALGLCLTTCGCAQFVMLSYLIHGPPMIEPDFDAETQYSLSDPDTTVAVVCYVPTDLKWNFPQIDDQIAYHVTTCFNEHHIKPVDAAYVKAWTDNHPDWEKAAEIGAALKADFVVEIEIADFSLYEGTSTTLYRGRTQANIHVVKMNESGGGERVYSKNLNFAFPVQVPRNAFEQSLSDFQREYLSRLSERIGFLFYERSHGDTIGWSN